MAELCAWQDTEIFFEQFTDRDRRNEDRSFMFIRFGRRLKPRSPFRRDGSRRVATLVEIRTDDGLVGWGESFCQGLEVPHISATIIRDCFADMIIGENPLDTERLWFAMYNRSRDFGRKGSVMAAISGIDIALWDIAGQAYGQPVWQLFGGAFRRDVEPYATGFYRIDGAGESDRLVEEALRYHANGFRHMKVKLGFGVRDDIEVMNAIHEAVEGLGVTLMVDTNHAYGRAEALYLGQAMAEMNLRWYEEPVVPEDLESYASLATGFRWPSLAAKTNTVSTGSTPFSGPARSISRSRTSDPAADSPRRGISRRLRNPSA